MKKYASPGIDSHPIETGVYNSGSGMSPDYQSYARHGKIVDPSSRNPVWGLKTGRLIGNFPATQVPGAASLRIRRRGMSPWGGYPGHVTAYYQGESMDSMLNVGGSVDHNAGASPLIAGGPGAASSMVRMGATHRVNRGAKLPTLPAMIDRGGDNPLPSGGQRGTIAAPLVPEMLGLPSVIKISNAPGSSHGPSGMPTPTTIPQWIINNVRVGLPRRYQFATIYFDLRGNLITVNTVQQAPPLRWAFGFTYSTTGWSLKVNPAYTVVN